MLTDGCGHSPLKVVVLHCRRTRSRKARGTRRTSRVYVRARAQNPIIPRNLYYLLTEYLAQTYPESRGALRASFILGVLPISL